MFFHFCFQCVCGAVIIFSVSVSPCLKTQARLIGPHALKAINCIPLSHGDTDKYGRQPKIKLKIKKPGIIKMECSLSAVKGDSITRGAQTVWRVYICFRS